MSPVDTLAACRSVGGNFVPNNSAAVAATGTRQTPSCTFQSVPAADNPLPTRVPMMIPPGHQACSTFSLCVLSSGYSVAINGLMTASTMPCPSPTMKNDDQRIRYTSAEGG